MIRATTLPGSVQTLVEARENMRAIEQLAKDKRCTLLVDLRQIRSQSREAREYYTRPENAKALLAVAVLVGSPMSRVIGNFFIGFSKPGVPTRLFAAEDDAIAWLREFRD
jgi:hypothetical protein